MKPEEQLAEERKKQAIKIIEEKLGKNAVFTIDAVVSLMIDSKQEGRDEMLNEQCQKIYGKSYNQIKQEGRDEAIKDIAGDFVSIDDMKEGLIQQGMDEWVNHINEYVNNLFENHNRKDCEYCQLLVLVESKGKDEAKSDWIKEQKHLVDQIIVLQEELGDVITEKEKVLSDLLGWFEEEVKWQKYYDEYGHKENIKYNLQVIIKAKKRELKI